MLSHSGNGLFYYPCYASFWFAIFKKLIDKWSIRNAAQKHNKRPKSVTKNMALHTLASELRTEQSMIRQQESLKSNFWIFHILVLVLQMNNAMHFSNVTDLILCTLGSSCSVWYTAQFIAQSHLQGSNPSNAQIWQSTSWVTAIRTFLNN